MENNNKMSLRRQPVKRNVLKLGRSLESLFVTKVNREIQPCGTQMVGNFKNLNDVGTLYDIHFNNLRSRF